MTHDPGGQACSLVSGLLFTKLSNCDTSFALELATIPNELKYSGALLEQLATKYKADLDNSLKAILAVFKYVPNHKYRSKERKCNSSYL
jgi:hypothetical protein